VATSTLLNTHVRDNFKAIGDAWTSYTPTWTGSTTNPAIGNGTLAGYYLSAGKLTIARIELTMGSTTTYGTGSWRFTMPVTAQVPAGAGGNVGGAALFDTSGSARYFRHVFLATTTYVCMNDEAGVFVGQLAPFTWASGDSLAIQFTYEAA
jgi:hypothetical protein